MSDAAAVPTPPRVLVLSQGFPRHADDPHAAFIASHALALAGAGWAPTVLCPSAPGLAGHEPVRGIDVVRFRYGPHRWETLAYTGAMHRRARGPAAVLLPFFLVGFLVEAVRRGRDATVLHAHWWLPSGVVAVVAGRLLGLPVVVTVHGTDATLARGPLRPVGRWVLRRADAVEAVSSDLARWCHDLAGVTARVAPMPLDPAFGPSGAPPPDGPVLAVGRLVPEKGFDVAIRAVAATGDQLELVGDGDQRGPLEALATELGASVHFAGSLPPAALPARYAAARLVVVPSRREGLGLVAAEAAASGRAVVASHVGGLPDLVDGSNGALVPPDDPDALAAALRSVDPALGAGGPARVAHLAAGSVGAAAADTYADLTARPARRALLRPLVRWGAGLLAVVALALAGRSLADALADARALDLHWSAGPVLRALGAAVGAGVLLSLSWTALVRARDDRLRWRDGLSVWWLGQLGRYLPTGLGSLPARVALARRRGFAARPVLLATGIETAALPLACLVLWLATVATPVGPIGAGVVAVGGVVGLRRAGFSALISGAYVATVVGQVALRALGLGALFALAGASTPGSGDLIGAVGGAYLLGLLAVFAPGGVGVREVLLANALTPSAGVAAATAAAVGWRLVEIVAELVLLVATRRVARVTSGGPDKP